MQTKKSTIFIMVGLLILLVASYILYDKLSEDYTGNSNFVTNSNEDKEKAQDFEVIDSKNKEVKLSDMKGKPVVVNFWASWCGPCKSEMPDFDKMYKTYGSDVQFMMVNMTDGRQETVESASSFIKLKGFSFPIYYDVNMSAAMAYSVSAIPATYFIDKEGYIVSSAKGAISENILEEGIKQILE